MEKYATRNLRTKAYFEILFVLVENLIKTLRQLQIKGSRIEFSLPTMYLTD